MRICAITDQTPIKHTEPIKKRDLNQCIHKLGKISFVISFDIRLGPIRPRNFSLSSQNPATMSTFSWT